MQAADRMVATAVGAQVAAKVAKVVKVVAMAEKALREAKVETGERRGGAEGHVA